MGSIAIGADDAGAPLKERLAAYLQDHGYEVKDFGDGDGVDYPDVAAEVAEAVARGEHDRAATAHDPYSAERARKSNNAQVLTMGARVIAPEAAEKVLEHWLSAEFEPGPSSPKVAKLEALDARYHPPASA